MSKFQQDGTHYQKAIQPITYIVENDMSYCAGNVVKYISRYQDKAGVSDLKKCIHYCLFIMRDEYGTIEDEDIDKVMEYLQ